LRLLVLEEDPAAPKGITPLEAAGIRRHKLVWRKMLADGLIARGQRSVTGAVDSFAQLKIYIRVQPACFHIIEQLIEKYIGMFHRHLSQRNDCRLLFFVCLRVD